MIIRREFNGQEQEIELTSQEVIEAYLEYLDISYRQDIFNKLDEMSAEELNYRSVEELKGNNIFIEGVLERFDKYLSNDAGWNEYLEDSITETIGQM